MYNKGVLRAPNTIYSEFSLLAGEMLLRCRRRRRCRLRRRRRRLSHELASSCWSFGLGVELVRFWPFLYCCFILVNTRRCRRSLSLLALPSLLTSTLAQQIQSDEAALPYSETKRYITLECQSFLLQSSYSLCFNPFQFCPPFVCSLARSLYRNHIVV